MHEIDPSWNNASRHMAAKNDLVAVDKGFRDVAQGHIIKRLSDFFVSADRT